MFEGYVIEYAYFSSLQYSKDDKNKYDIEIALAIQKDIEVNLEEGYYQLNLKKIRRY